METAVVVLSRCWLSRSERGKPRRLALVENGRADPLPSQLIGLTAVKEIRVVGLRKSATGMRVRVTPRRPDSAAGKVIEALVCNPGTACSLDIAVRTLGERHRKFERS